MITMCPRTDRHLTYMIDIVLTTEFAIAAGGAMTGADPGHQVVHCGALAGVAT